MEATQGINSSGANNAHLDTSWGSATKGPQFRFHKNLATSRYKEFLAESDDEEFFDSVPKTKKG